MDRVRWVALSITLVVVNLIALVAVPRPAAAWVLPMSLEQMAAGADSVVVGTVVQRTSQWNASHTRISTTVVLAVEDTIKGTPGLPTVTITVPGGTVDGTWEKVSDTAEFNLGERAVVFLSQRPQARFEVYGQAQGKLKVEQEKVGGVPLPDFKAQVIRAASAAPEAPNSETRRVVGPITFAVSPPAVASAPALLPAAALPGWTTILSENFEGAFPGTTWSLYPGSPTTANPAWGKASYLPYAGTSSGWCAGSSLNPAINYYPNNMNAWMVYGPFSLSDATAATLDLYHKMMTADTGDAFWVLMSTNTTPQKDWYGYGQTGGSGAWHAESYNLRSWPYWGNLTGQSQVWLALAFQSNASGVNIGAFVDDMVLQKYTGPTPQITSVTPPSASAGTNTPVTIAGTGFGATAGTVNFLYRSDKAPITGGIVSWTDTSIVATVPTAIIENYPASASSGPVFVTSSSGIDSPFFPFTVTFSYGGGKWPGASPVVGYRVNPNTPDTTGEEVAIQNAANAWNAVPGKNFAFRYDGTTTETQAGLNSHNDIMWNNLGVGTIALASVWGSGDTLGEVDIEFNDYYTWSTDTVTPAGAMDVQTVATHELGHWLVLNDLYGNLAGFPSDSQKVMYGFGTTALMKRTLHADDMAGIRWIYPRAEPSVTTRPVDNITSNSARLWGILDWLGTATTVQVSFQYGLSTNYTSETAPVPLDSSGVGGAFNATASGLSPGATYHYRAKAVGNGTTYGDDMTFATTSAPPAVTTDDADGITGNSAVLHGTLSSKGSAASVALSFQWGLSDNYSNEVASGTATGTGTFGHTISGLAPGTTYHFRAKAVGDGTSYGSDRTFTTLIVPPTVTTDNATGVTGITAMLNGTLNNLGSAASVAVSFQWGLSSNYTGGTAPASTNATGPFSFALGGLTPGTTYHFRARAVGDGTSYGLDNTFTTLTTPPTVTTDNATGVTGNTATLNGTLNNLGTAANVALSFQWGLSSNYTSETAPASANATGPFSFALGGLTPGATYHFRTRAVGDGTSYGLDKTFTTLIVPPTVTTDNATAITTTSTTLHGTLNDLGTATTVVVSFQWGLSTNYTGDTIPAVGMATGPFSFALNSLTPNTTYHYRARAVGDGTSYGIDRTFTTLPPVPPAVTTDNATGVSSSSAFLIGTLSSKGSTPAVALSFELGLTAGNYTASTGSISASATGPFLILASGLLPNTTYHYRARAVGDGTAYGNDRSFTTAIPGPNASVDMSIVLPGSGRPDSGWVVPVTVKFFSPGANVITGVPLLSFNITTAKSGSVATCNVTGVPSDTYDVTIVSPHNLTNWTRAVISAPRTALDLGFMSEGNANDDSIINISDFGILAVAFGKATGQPGFDARADFDRNGVVNIADFGMLAVNFMHSSPIYWPPVPGGGGGGGGGPG